MSIKNRTVNKINLFLFTVLFLFINLTGAWAQIIIIDPTIVFKSLVVEKDGDAAVAKVGDTLSITFSIEPPSDGDKVFVANYTRMKWQFNYDGKTIGPFNNIGVDTGAWTYSTTYTFTEGDINYKSGVTNGTVVCHIYNVNNSNNIIGPYEASQGYVIDNCPPKPSAYLNKTQAGGVPVTPLDSVTGYLKANTQFVIDISDSKYQTSPTPGTQCYLDLTQLGRENKVELTNKLINGTNATFTTQVFNTNEFTERDSVDIYIPYTLTDQVNAEVTKNDFHFKFDNKPPKPAQKTDAPTDYFTDGDFTGFLCDDGLINKDETINIRAAVNSSGKGQSDSVNVTLYYESENTAKYGSNENWITNESMDLEGNYAEGGVSKWKKTYITTAKKGKKGKLKATFTFKDVAGNTVVIDKTVDIDTRENDYKAIEQSNSVALSSTTPITPPINCLTPFRIVLNFQNGWNPSEENGKVTADLSDIGLGVIDLSPNEDRTIYSSALYYPDTLETKVDKTVKFTYTISDKGIEDITGDFDPANFVYDNIPPKCTEANTKFVLAEGDTHILRDKDFTVYGEIENFDSDTARVSFRYKPNGAGAGTVIANYDMEVDGTPPTVGGTAKWKKTIEDNTAFNDKNGTIVAVFTFTDNAGNITTFEQEVPIDSRTFSPNAQVWCTLGTGTAFSVMNADGDDTINRKEQFRLVIDFSAGNWFPQETGKITVDLSEIGLGNAIELVRDEDNKKYSSPDYIAQDLDANDKTFNINYVITDDSLENGTYAGIFSPVNFKFDNIEPIINEVNTNIVLADGDSSILKDKDFTVTAEVGNYDTDIATVKFKYKANGQGDGVDLVTYLMTVDGPVAGTTIKWKSNISNYSAFNDKSGTILAIFTVTDNAGNVVTTEREIAIDSRTFAPKAQVWCTTDNGTTYSVMDASGNDTINRKEKFRLEIDFSSGDWFPQNTGKITVDLSALGLGNAVELQRDEANKKYITDNYEAKLINDLDIKTKFSYVITDTNLEGGTYTGIFAPAEFKFDNILPVPNEDNTRYVLPAGDTFILYNKTVIMEAEVAKYDGDKVRIDFKHKPESSAAVAVPALLVNPMSIVGTPEDGEIAKWRDELNNPAFNDMVGTMQAFFTFTDNAGNEVVVQKDIGINSYEFAIDAKIYCNSDSDTVNFHAMADDESINRAESFYFEVVFAENKWFPSEAGKVTVDLSEIDNTLGENGVVELVRVEGTRKFKSETFKASERPDKDGNYQLLYTITDESLNGGTKSGPFTPQNFRFDNILPKPIEGTLGGTDGTRFVSADAIITNGDAVQVQAQVSEHFIGDKVKVIVYYSPSGGGAEEVMFPYTGSDPVDMTPVGTEIAGQNMTWLDTLTCSFSKKVGTLRAEFTFYDEVGNTVTLTREIEIDYRVVNIIARVIDKSTDALLDPAIINAKTEFYLRIYFGEGAEGSDNYFPEKNTTKITADISVISDSGTVEFNKNTTNRTYEYGPIPATNCNPLEKNIQFKYSITGDEVIGEWNNKSFQPTDIWFDNRNPEPVSTDPDADSGTGFVVEEGKRKLIRGDDIVLRAEVERYLKDSTHPDGVSVRVDMLEKGTGAVVATKMIDRMTLAAGAVDQGKAIWNSSFDPMSYGFEDKEGRLKATFTFFDFAGNEEQVVKEFQANFKQPEFVYASTTVYLCDEGGNKSEETSLKNPLVATTSCYLSFEVKLEEVPTDGVTVTIDLSPIGKNDPLTLTQGSGPIFKGDYQIPPGTFDDKSREYTFVVTAVDGNNITNTTDTEPGVTIDNLKPVINGTITITNTTPGKIVDKYHPENYKIGDTFEIVANISNLEPNGRAFVDLSKLSVASSAAELKLDYGTRYKYEGVIINCKDAEVVCDATESFQLMAYDTVRNNGDDLYPGHYIFGETEEKKFDNEPPVVNGVTYTVTNSKGVLKGADEWIQIGDKITIYLDIASSTVSIPIYDGQEARLTNYDRYGFNENIFQANNGKYEITLSVREGTAAMDIAYNNYVATMTYELFDNDYNYSVDPDFIATDTFYIKKFDQVRPDATYITFTTFTEHGIPSVINRNDTVYFRVAIGSAIRDVATVTVDVSAFTGVTNDFIELTDDDNDYVWEGSLAAIDGISSRSIQFKATVYDNAGNSTVKGDNLYYTLDTVAPVFTSNYIQITRTNNDNPLPNVANINDELTVYASFEKFENGDAASATIYYGDTFIATAPIVTTNRVNGIATFIVKKSGVDRWPAMDGTDNASLTYILTSRDVHGNNGDPIIAYSNANDGAHEDYNFVVRNVLPGVDESETRFILNPNNALTELVGTENVPVYNIGDKLFVHAALTYNTKINNAWIDLSPLVGAGANKYALDDLSGEYIASRSSGIDFISDFTFVRDIATYTLRISMEDVGGKISSTTRKIIVDTKRPEITSIDFEGTRFLITASEELNSDDASLLINNWVVKDSNNVGSDITINSTKVSYKRINGKTITIQLNDSARGEFQAWSDHGTITMNIPEGSFQDFCHNTNDAITNSVVTVSENQWSEEVKIESITLTKNFGAVYDEDEIVNDPLVMTIVFSKNMKFDNLVGINPSSTSDHSHIAIFPDNVAINDSFLSRDPSFNYYYVFQSDDIFTRIDDRTLSITFGKNGSVWIARKLSLSDSIHLKLCHRYNNATKRFAYDEFSLPMKYYSYSDAVTMTDNRSAWGTLARDITVTGPKNNKPLINFEEKTLTIEFSEPVLLYNALFPNNLSNPYVLNLPTDKSSPVTDYKTKIKLCYDNYDLSTAYQLTFDAMPTENDYASRTVKLKLSSADIKNILEMYENYSYSPSWGLRIESGAFKSIWNINCSPYANFIDPVAGYTESEGELQYEKTHMLAAAAISDKPPTKEDKGNLKVEFELIPGKVEDIDVRVPFDKSVTPVGEIYKTSGASLSDKVAVGKFTGWSTRTVNGITRNVVSYTFDDDFLVAPFDTASCALVIKGFRNIFGFEYPDQIATNVYGISDKNNSAIGFTTASTTLIVDTKLPEVVSFSTEEIGFGLCAVRAGEYTVKFHEPIDTTNTNPKFSISTGTQVINLEFKKWERDGVDSGYNVAYFTNPVAITSSLPNGAWNYSISNVRDLANNYMDEKTGFVQVRSHIVQVKEVHSYTKQSNIDTANFVVDKPFNYAVIEEGKVTVGVEYQAVPENPPHWLRFYTPEGVKVGNDVRFYATADEMLATATFTATELPIAVLEDNKTLHLRIVDKAGNETANLTTVTYDATAPIVSLIEFDATQIATYTDLVTLPQKTYYANSKVLPVIVTLPSADIVNILITDVGGATVATYSVTSIGGNRYSANVAPLAEGDYIVKAYDNAGNLNAGASAVYLHVDDTKPQVTSITIDSGLPTPVSIIGQIAANSTSFVVDFNEAINPLEIPVLRLATGTVAEISMNFVEWRNDYTTAVFQNANAVTTSMPAGFYYYEVSNAHDLTGNFVEPLNNNDSFKLSVQTNGAVANVSIVSYQGYGINEVIDRPVNMNRVSASNPVGLILTYPGLRINDDEPHQVEVVDEDGNHIASLTSEKINAYISIATITSNVGYSDGHTYRFRLKDDHNLGAFLSQTMVVDNTSPTVSSYVFENGIGSYTDNLYYFNSGIKETGTASFVLTEEDTLVYYASGTSPVVATFTGNVSSSAMTHALKWPSKNLADGEYGIMFVDGAGNAAQYMGRLATMKVVVDTLAPTVTDAFLSNVDGVRSVNTRLGYTKANEGYFAVTFSEAMHSGYTPNVYLYNDTDTTKINLTFVKWSPDFKTAIYVNRDEIGDSITPTDYKFNVSNATDLAGNEISSSDPASGNTVLIVSQRPRFDLTFNSKQTHLYGDTELTNHPFNYSIAPGIATITIRYGSGHPVVESLPHRLLVYDGNSATSENVATMTIDAGKVAINNDSFGATPTSRKYYYKIIDAFDSISDFAATSVELDKESPVISTFQINKNYYNPTNAASLVVTARRGDAYSDGLVLAFVSAATGNIVNLRDDFQANGNFEIKRDWATANLEDGDYEFAIYDKAGNEATLPGTMPMLHVDRLAPKILEVISYPDPINAGNAGMATITVKFDEPISNGLGNLTLSLATSTQSVTIPCTFTGFEDVENTIASFSVGAVTNSIPQGWYNCVVTNARDLTGNVMSSQTVGKVKIQSRGPDISSINFFSSQKTVAASNTERFKNVPYSFNVADGNLVVNVVFRKAPAVSGINYKLHIYAPDGNVFQADLDYEVDNINATYTWNYTNPPTLLTPDSGTYRFFVADESGESLESATLVVDNEAPIYAANSMEFSGAVDAANSTVYYNSSLYPDAFIRLTANDNSNLKLRLTGPVTSPATDTYILSNTGNIRTLVFDGKNNRSTEEVRSLLADGEYAVALADAAGNLAVCPAPLVDATNENTIYKLVVDTTSPVVSGYRMYFSNGAGYTNIAEGGDFSPRGGNLLVKVNIADAALVKTSSWYVEFYRQDNGQVFRKLPLENQTGNGDALTWGVLWDGKDSNGNYVPENLYSVRVTDYVGNRAVNTSGSFITSTIMIISSEFNIISANQTAPNAGVVYFNHTLTSGNVNFMYGKLNNDATVSSWNNAIGTVDEGDETAGRKLTFTLPVPASFESGSYQLYFAGVTNKYGANLTNEYVNIITDGDGPVVTDCSYNGLPVGTSDSVIITFDQDVEQASALIPAAYSVTNTSGNPVNIISVNYVSPNSVRLNFGVSLGEGVVYNITATGVRDSMGNSGKNIPFAFRGRDVTAPVLNLAMFSNPMNLRDLIVVVTTNERLNAAPVVEIRTGTIVERQITRAHATNNMAYVMSYTVKNSNGQATRPILKALATDTSGIGGESNSEQFLLANVRANTVVEQTNSDGTLKLNIKEDSFKNDTQIRVLEHELTLNASGTIEMRSSMRSFLKSLRGSTVTETATPTIHLGSELIPLSKAYEVSVNGTDVNNGFDVSISPSIATASVGMGLFYQSGDEWKLVTAYRSNDNSYKAALKSSTTLALMRDSKAPVITLDDSMDFTKEFDSGHPEFKGKVEDWGSGVDNSALEAVFDGNLTQNFTVNDDGEFSFRTLTELTGGSHTVELKVGDRTGNRATSGTMRFDVVNELKVSQIIQWPNPARSNYMYIRFKTNRADITEENVKIRIFDVAGHRVRNLSVAPRRNGGVYDFKWDMLNGKGKRVANGVYFAKVEIRDPNNPSIKFKATLKLAVLR